MKTRFFKPESYVQLISCLLILLWVYAATSKLINYEQSRMQMMNQVFPDSINGILLWAVPLIELLISGLLLFHGTRKVGLFLSAILLFLFSGYVLLVMLNVFGRIPCSCGGIIAKLGWGQHLVFNLIFLGLALIGFMFYDKEGGGMGKDL
ncbi:MauE/DoxX family redox-associated membrane protein [Daejeonella sp. H1SJ63]|uniref:MauE/DoxX family redox-associated membrane protein n=1 Tax=Daejeonella sp. H1SJ63 TaxID=3034145 RepID=UPI0023EC0091|nr:MauE/DoxX family redox-associated membrane protein [Daejeonella sp. H1SJ63]